jgi:hypothetical protein
MTTYSNSNLNSVRCPNKCEQELMEQEAVNEVNIFSNAEFYCDGCGWNALGRPHQKLIVLYDPADYVAELAGYLEKLNTSDQSPISQAPFQRDYYTDGLVDQ